MQSSTTPTETRLSILQDRHMTATVTTESGSRYTVVARPAAGVVVIHDTKAWVCQGVRLEVIDGYMRLVDRRGRTLASTTRIVEVDILTN